MKVADTCALYALYVANDEHHAAAKSAIGSGESVVVPSEVLAETIELLQHRHGFDFARQAHRHLRSLPNVEFQPTADDPWDDVAGAAARLFDQHGGKLAYVDAVVVAWCRRRRLKPLSFDRRVLAAATQT